MQALCAGVTYSVVVSTRISIGAWSRHSQYPQGISTRLRADRHRALMASAVRACGSGLRFHHGRLGASVRDGSPDAASKILRCPALSSAKLVTRYFAAAKTSRRDALNLQGTPGCRAVSFTGQRPCPGASCNIAMDRYRPAEIAAMSAPFTACASASRLRASVETLPEAIRMEATPG